MQSDKYSTCTLLLGTECVFGYFDKLLKNSILPIISVCSGNGAIEKDIEDKFDIKIICIEPNLFSIKDREPDFRTVAELVRVRPELVGKCNVFINWSDPTKTYDYDSLCFF